MRCSFSAALLNLCIKHRTYSNRMFPILKMRAVVFSTALGINESNLPEFGLLDSPGSKPQFSGSNFG